ncbi:Yox1p KNAG_0B03460 [Huiozyma naganishii CBS 8797]|uniref:Homeobox domain-containing protein n=1 Tax=Huiozyma naganishii (strain ATCC MYA-139 / BCRC 22969 / CBS 8797 / KCTC 17520 / NBRC 10181 / NCYC 3082 / Yp74L-3) TaxID=1071383 RepID=J7RGX5_HUIN7|nr:hypothetical protein KNAG_0B03460 [Kazachstania naganishii CBS 8797]CCK68788.1 hypothetical protein KNAG_0B03460 [Kazachstania naganishii CBS 8797]
MTSNFASSTPLLPSLASLFTEEKSRSDPCSPLLDSFKNNFKSDTHGIIRLPPLGINRPKSVESALRHTASLPSLATLKTPVSDDDVEYTSKAPKDDVWKKAITVEDDLESRSTAVLESAAPQPKSAVPSTPTAIQKVKSIPNNNNNSAHKKVDMGEPLNAVKATLTPTTASKKRAFAFITHSQDTFGVKEPKIDNAPLARRKRRRTSTQELNILQAGFEICPTPNRQQRAELAERCDMSEKAVQIWFQNKRQSIKRQRNNAANKAAGHLTPNTTATNVPTDNSSHIDNTSHMERTPITNKVKIPTLDSGLKEHSTPKLQIPDSIVTPTKKSPTRNAASTENDSPVKISNATYTPSSSVKRGQALTFHLKTDKKILTPLKTSPKNKVNKLINGYTSDNGQNSKATHNSPSEHRFRATSISPVKKGVPKLHFKSQTTRVPLKDLDTNMFKN